MRLPPGEFFGKGSIEMHSDGVHVSTRRYEPFEEQPWHTHEHATFYVQLTGDHIDGCQQTDWHLSPLTTSFHPVSAPHRSRLGPSGAYGINLEVSDEWLSRHGLGPGSLGSQEVVSSGRTQIAGVRLLSAVMHEAQADLDPIAIDLIDPFVREPAEDTTNPLPWLANAEERILSNFREPLRLCELAAEAGVHSVYFARAFRRRHGCSLIAFLQRLRLAEAIRLTLGGASCGEAAISAGFVDQFYFYKVLRQHYGIRPRSIKEIARSGLVGFIS